GQLCLYFTPRSGRLAMVRLALRALFNRLRQDRDFNAVCSGEVWIDTKRKRLNVAMDGEVEPMDSPLHYQIWPGALRVIVPAEGASPAGSG
ncbi:MAG: diacylglycerol kinase family lipid kinase, partial [Phycisphaerae bacterium]